MDIYAAFRCAAARPNGPLSAAAAQALPAGPVFGQGLDLEIPMQDLLLLALGAASFALLALYLVACERG